MADIKVPERVFVAMYKVSHLYFDDIVTTDIFDDGILEELGIIEHFTDRKLQKLQDRIDYLNNHCDKN